MESSKNDWTLSGTGVSLQFFFKILFQFMNFSEAMFYENYLTSDFHTNTVISRRVCLLVKRASKIVIRPIHDCFYHRAKDTDWVNNDSIAWNNYSLNK